MDKSPLKKIVFLIRTPLMKRDYERFGCDLLCKRGFRVEVLDVTEMTNPDYLQAVDEKELSNVPIVTKISNNSEISEYLKLNAKDSFFIVFTDVDFCTANIFRLFKVFGIRYARCNVNSIPMDLSLIRGNNLFDRISKITKKIIKRQINYKESFFAFCLRFNFFKSFFLAPTCVLVGGKKHSEVKLQKEGITKEVYIHTMDYDVYLKQDNKNVQNGHAVFLDEYAPYHPDYKINKSFKAPNASDYYTSMCNFFDNFEKIHNMKVIIAAHPRSDYSDKKYVYGGREILKGQTIDLIANSKIVLIHSSTAINFAVLFQKPMIFLTTNGLEQTSQKPIIRSFAKQFEQQVINVNEVKKIYFTDADHLNLTAYENYKNNYIKVNGTPEKLFWDVVADYILTKN